MQVQWRTKMKAHLRPHVPSLILENSLVVSSCVPAMKAIKCGQSLDRRIIKPLDPKSGHLKNVEFLWLTIEPWNGDALKEDQEKQAHSTGRVVVK